MSSLTSELETVRRLHSELPNPDYEAVRDRALVRLKMGHQSSAGKAIDAFIKELRKQA